MRKYFFTFALTLVTIMGNAQTNTYDVNRDGMVNVTDITCLVNNILGISNPNDELSSYLTCPDDHHPHLIDLGLPSGTMWACCNVGASTPEAYGGYYAWGETVEKNTYNWDTYIHCDGNAETCHDIGSDIADSKYDVANVKWGFLWRMPSENQINELLDNCSLEYTKLKSIKGWKFTGPSGGTIFLPLAGYRWNENLFTASSCGYYWSSKKDPSYTDEAKYLFVGSTSTDLRLYDFGKGCSIRPVSVANCKPLSLSMNSLEIYAGETATVEITSGNGSYKVTSSGVGASLSGTTITITGGFKAGSAVVTVTDMTTGSTQYIHITVAVYQAYVSCPDDNHPHAIDLGFPSGTKWACCNVGASAPEQIGGLYQWGATEIDQDTPFWGRSASDISGTQYDVAHVKWGESWCMTNSFYDLSNCTYKYSTLNGAFGMMFVSKLNGASIFLAYKDNSYGGYWASSPHGNQYDAYGLWMNYDETEGGGNSRIAGCMVRPIWVE